MFFDHIDGDKNPPDNKGNTPLHVAAGYGFPEIVKLFLDNIKGEKNPRNSVDGTTPLHNATNTNFQDDVLEEIEGVAKKANWDFHHFDPISQLILIQSVSLFS